MTTPLERLREALLSHGEFSFNMRHRIAIIETLEAVAVECADCGGPCGRCAIKIAVDAIQPLLEEES